MTSEYEFIDKTVFFPKEGILAIGDLHIGYEHALRKSGIQMPETQVRDTIKNLEKIVERIKEKKYNLKKIVFLGDIKHFFGYEWKERFYFNKILNFLGEHLKEKDIILIKGNHDKFDFVGKKMKNYYFNKGIMFLHGHVAFPQIFEQRVKTIVMGHLHPSVMLRDKQNIKREKYKCFLIGKFKRKKVFILPSFLGIIEGSAVNEGTYRSKNFSIIPSKTISKFNVYVVGENNKIFEFGKVNSFD